jgi:hypothetical protein
MTTVLVRDGHAGPVEGVDYALNRIEEIGGLRGQIDP